MVLATSMPAGRSCGALLGPGGPWVDGGDVAPDASGNYLVDVAGLPLPELLASADSALDRCLERVLTDVDAAAENFAAFGNTP